MTIKNTLIIGLLAIGLFGCAEKTEPVETDESEVSNESDEQSGDDVESATTDVKADNTISFTNQSKFTITTKNAGSNPNTGTDNLDIFVNNDLLSKPIKITQDLSYSKVALGTKRVPKNAVFAFSTWFAGGGAIYYGIVKNGVLHIYQTFEDEGSQEDQPYILFREIDPNVPTKDPAYYISYDSDNNTTKDLMIAFTKDGKALFAKYEGQSRHLALKFVKDASEGRNIVGIYDEIVNGEVNGTYKLTHSGNWDNAEYSLKKNKKKFDFTINHDVTIMGDTYRTTPSL